MCCRVFIQGALLTFWSSLNGNLSSFPFFILVVSFSCGRPTFSYLVVFFLSTGTMGNGRNDRGIGETNMREGEIPRLLNLMLTTIWYIWFSSCDNTRNKKKRCAIHETWTTRTVVCYRRNLSRSVIGGGDRGRLFLRRRWLGTSKRFNCPRFSKYTSYVVIPLTNVSLSFPC